MKGKPQRCVCVCLCVCVWERESERERESRRWKRQKGRKHIEKKRKKKKSGIQLLYVICLKFCVFFFIISLIKQPGLNKMYNKFN